MARLSSADILGTSTIRPIKRTTTWLPVEFVKCKSLKSNSLPSGCKSLTGEEETFRPNSSVSTTSAISAGSSTSPDSITDELTKCSPKKVQKALEGFQKNGWEKECRKAPQIKIHLNGSSSNGIAKQSEVYGPVTPIKKADLMTGTLKNGVSSNKSQNGSPVKRPEPTIQKKVENGVDKKKELSPKLKEPSPKLKEQSPKLKEPSPKLKEPSPKLKEPSPKLKETPPRLIGPQLPPKHISNGGDADKPTTSKADLTPTKSENGSPVKRTESPGFIGPRMPPNLKNGDSTPGPSSVKKLTVKRSMEDEGPYSYDWADVPLRTKHGPGFFNSRNDCFMNSVLQFVFHTPQLVKLFLRTKQHFHQNPCMFCSLQGVLNDIINRKVKKMFCKTVKEVVRDGFPTLKWLDAQEDAHEMLTFLFSKLEPPIETRRSLPNGKKPPTEIDKIFGGILSRRMSCSNCKHSSWSTEEFREFNLNLNCANLFQNDNAKLQYFVDAYFNPERMRDFKCEKCKAVDTSTKTFSIQDAPRVLVIQLKRFKHTGSKIQMPISVPHELDLTGHTRTKTNLSYRLYGFINHYGATTNSGHYTATMKGFDGNWYSFDDEQVEQTRVNQVPTQYPYILFYANKAFTTMKPTMNGLPYIRYANGAPPHKKMAIQIKHTWSPKIIT
ncbi:unnamed protein product [Bursaphelenchus okinawaensis]|uniref:Ubiquitin carboxyl-terminal hydrolase 36 n=1 Tax=Bursaphelenchus okinawaensis TaxID=465554 RepID=A0A811LNE2_9BILA|nr:unnamed protein product [Bursaphelenchus okinawaensis]CAG9124438.1 unnamed protein product [Bursaphelenchus okinawaensis]